MRIVLQRVTSARVVVEDDTVGAIENGLLLLTGFSKTDSVRVAEISQRAAEKITGLRIFSNAQGKLDFSVKDIGGDILCIPQFTLLGKTDKGRRPDFTEAMAPDEAAPAFDEFCAKLESALDKPVSRGVFGADMKVSLLNDGPFTLTLEF